MAIHPKSEEIVIRIHDDDEEPPKSNSMAPTNFKHVAAKSKARAEEKPAIKFKQFDVITGNHSSDHRSNLLALTPSHCLIRNPKADCYYIPRYHQPELSPETISLIMKEREILNDNLPDSIFVRDYQKRIDLLRALIIGPPVIFCQPIGVTGRKGST
ncbi:uncharacterized protein LOC113276327 [Papaver somniferum]|uniref:uncharacterized protein LOC113276327 n=1 Tax=Papaver somniferum TaxID=3469 RepID=UPI000E6FB58E|nr:uncharacterized protein LOC113276327 [Papaver somniferum]